MVTIDDLDVAIVHKHFVEHGGAERVAEALAEVFDAPLYVGFGDEEVMAQSDADVRELFSDSLMLSIARRHGILRELYSVDAWEHQPELAEYDILIQTAPQPGGYVPADDQTIVRYVHDLPRTIYDRFQMQDQTVVSRFVARLYRILYATQARFADEWIVNSEYIQDRLDTYLDEESTVVYPPVNIEQFEPQETDDFYLTYSRLTERKGILEIIEAFASMPERRLIVGGTGPVEETVRQRASELPNVEYRGYLSEDEKVDLLGRAKAVVFGADTESFGIVPVEAFASGTPVIGLNSGYTKYHIEDGQNGLLFEWSSNQPLERVIDHFEEYGVGNSSSDLISQSKKFRRDRFSEEMLNAIESHI